MRVACLLSFKNLDARLECPTDFLLAHDSAKQTARVTSALDDAF
jgi:hypothetical protein